MTRNNARALGLQRYFTGKPCARGHVAERYVRSHCCVACMRYNTEQFWQRNPGSKQAINLKYRRALRLRFNSRLMQKHPAPPVKVRRGVK